MASNIRKHYLFASDFDQTLTFNDTGYVLSELVGIPVQEFERKIKGMAALNLVQQGAELSYLLLHDPEFRAKVRRHHLSEVGKRIRLKENIQQVYDILDQRIDGYHFDFYVLSAAPVEVIQAALEGIVPKDHIFGTEFKYNANGEIETLVRATAGYGKVARLEQLACGIGVAAGSRGVRGRWQLGYSRDAARQPARRVHDCGFGIEACGADRQTYGPERQRAGYAGADPGRNCRLDAAEDSPAVRVLWIPDPRMGERADRLGDAARQRVGGRKGGSRRRHVGQSL